MDGRCRAARRAVDDDVGDGVELPTGEAVARLEHRPRGGVGHCRDPTGERRGIGLAAVREQVDAWGGTLAVYSEAGRGSLFEVELPYRTSATEGTP